MQTIRKELEERMKFFENEKKYIELQRIEQRTNYDLEMLKEVGTCKGIENYSRHFSYRKAGEPPPCLIDYFPSDYLLIIDESHQTIPQLHAMCNGDRARKLSLVDFGFRLPSAYDNRPLQFPETYARIHQVVYVSATPGEWEIKEAEGEVVEQVIRPTGLLDPEIEIRPADGQVEDCLGEIHAHIQKKGRVLLTTLTKRLAEELTKYLTELGVKAKYLHSDIDTIERVQIIRDLRHGIFDVLVGINLLREGLDIPEVSLVVILDADKEGFLRSNRSLTQTAGRAARNINGRVIMYADKITESMRKTIDETNRRREKQTKYNIENNIVPTPLNKSREMILQQTVVSATKNVNAYIESENVTIAADPVVQFMTEEQLANVITKTKKQMEVAAKEMDFMEAARLRDEMFELQKLMKDRFGKSV